MATPRVFVSSTFYDLKYIRENLKYFIKTIGYEPVLSEDGDVFYNPKLHTHDSCLTEVPACQLFVLIVGGRYGGTFNKGEKSITNMEYEAAIKSKIPVFAMAESAVLAEHHVYNDNVKKNKKINSADILYPSVDNVKIFEFIDDVRKYAVNNSIVPFRDFTDIESYLKKQWAGMMFSFLNESINENRVADTLAEISKVNQKIEVLTTQILKSVGNDLQLVTVKLYEEMTSNESYRAATYFYEDKERKKRVKVTPLDFINAKNLKDLVSKFGIELKILTEGNTIISDSGDISKEYYDRSEKEFQLLKARIEEILHEYGLTSQKYIKEQAK
jgi:hypothetical protein